MLKRNLQINFQIEIVALVKKVTIYIQEESGFRYVNHRLLNIWTELLSISFN